MRKKIWTSFYTAGSYNVVNGTYLNSIPDSTIKMVWDSVNSLKYICIGTTSTDWSNLRIVNVDQYISRSSNFKPSIMNPFISTTVYPTLGTAGNMVRA